MYGINYLDHIVCDEFVQGGKGTKRMGKRSRQNRKLLNVLESRYFAKPSSLSDAVACLVDQVLDLATADNTQMICTDFILVIS